MGYLELEWAIFVVMAVILIVMSVAIKNKPLDSEGLVTMRDVTITIIIGVLVIILLLMSALGTLAYWLFR